MRMRFFHDNFHQTMLIVAAMRMRIMEKVLKGGVTCVVSSRLAYTLSCLRLISVVLELPSLHRSYFSENVFHYLDS